MSIKSLALLLGILPGALNASVTISEVFYDPSSSDADGEWIELMNQGAEAVNLSGWLVDASGPNLLLPEIVLPAGGTLVIFSNASTSHAPEGLRVWFENDSNMGNTHGFVGLWSSESQSAEFLQDYMEYGSGGHSWESQAVDAGHWPLDGFAPDVESGSSLRRLYGSEGPQDWIAESEPLAGNGETAIGDLQQPTLRWNGAQLELSWTYAGQAEALEVHGGPNNEQHELLERIAVNGQGRYHYVEHQSRPQNWKYWLLARSYNGILREIGGPYLLSEAGATLPEKTELLGAWPNPFNPGTRLNFRMARQGRAEISLYNVTGHRVAQLLDQHLSAGLHQINLDLADAAGGPYFARLRAGEQVSVIKLLLMK